MSVLPWILILLTVYHQITAGPHSYFSLSNEKVTWSEAMDQCLGEGRPVRRGDVDRWKKNEPPASLPNDVLVWIEANLEKTLLWKSKSGKRSFFTLAKQCYYKNTRPGRRNLAIYSPLSCFRECGKNRGEMYLQGGTCCCQFKNKRCEDEFPKCRESSGRGTAPGYTIYNFSWFVTLNVTTGRSVAMETEQPCFVGTFQTNTNNKTRLIVSETECNNSHSVLCIDDKFDHSRTNYRDEPVSYDEAAKECRQYSLSLPSKRQPKPNTDRGFLKKLANAVGTNLKEKSFWLDLSIEPELFWSTGEKFEEKGVQTRDLHSGCVAMQRSGKNKISLHVQPCHTKLPYLCSSETREPNTAEDSLKEVQISEAMAAGIAGLLFLVVFCVVAVSLYVLKRFGYLTVRNQKPAFNSTGEWDRTDDSVRSRSARRNKQVYLDELQSRLAEEKKMGGASSSATTTSTRHSLMDPPPTLASARPPIPVPSLQDTGQRPPSPEHLYDLVDERQLLQQQQQPRPPEEPGYRLAMPIASDHPLPGVQIVHQLPAVDALAPACRHSPETASEQRELLHQIRHAVDYMLNTIERPTAGNKSSASSHSTSPCMALKCEADVHGIGVGASFPTQPQPASEVTFVGSKDHDDVRPRHDDDEEEEEDQQRDKDDGEYSTLGLMSPLKAGKNRENRTTTTTTATTTTIVPSASGNADDQKVTLVRPLKVSPQGGSDVMHAETTTGSDTKSRNVNCPGDTEGGYFVLLRAATPTNDPAVVTTTPHCADHTPPAEAQHPSQEGKALPPDEKADPGVMKSEQEKIAEACAGSELRNEENHQSPAAQTATGDLRSSGPSALENPFPGVGGDEVIVEEEAVADDVSSTAALAAGSQVSSRDDETRKDEVVVVSLKKKSLKL